ncbi:MAG: hypothetical protein LBB82_11080 [Treponema sp.]|jgi:hypothetical protein|nr:hypothetical protein [Treponema sp.]
MIGTMDGSAALCEKREIAERQRNLFFYIPSRIILNEKGASFFTGHKKPLHCFETADGGRDFGFYLEKTGFLWLKKLIANNYLKKIEIQVKDISERRTHLEDAVKLGVLFNVPPPRQWLDPETHLQCPHGTDLEQDKPKKINRPRRKDRQRIF